MLYTAPVSSSASSMAMSRADFTRDTRPRSYPDTLQGSIKGVLLQGGCMCIACAFRLQGHVMHCNRARHMKWAPFATGSYNISAGPHH